MKKGSLKQSFMDNAAVGFFVRHSEWLSSWPFVIGYAAMITKQGMHPDLDTVAGFLMIGAGASFYLQKKYPTLSFRISGLMGATAALCLAAKGFDFNTMQVVNPWRFAPLTGPFIANNLVLWQKEAAAFSEKNRDSDSRFKRVLSRVLRYPVVTGGVVDLVNGPNLIMTAVSEADWMFLAAIGVFAMGDGGMLASDPRFQEKYKKFQEDKKTAALPPPAAPSTPPAPPKP